MASCRDPLQRLTSSPVCASVDKLPPWSRWWSWCRCWSWSGCGSCIRCWYGITPSSAGNRRRTALVLRRYWNDKPQSRPTRRRTRHERRSRKNSRSGNTIRARASPLLRTFDWSTRPRRRRRRRKKLPQIEGVILGRLTAEAPLLRGHHRPPKEAECPLTLIAERAPRSRRLARCQISMIFSELKFARIIDDS